MLTQKIQQATVAALKNRDQAAVSILRFVCAAIKNREIESRRPLTDQEVLAVVQKEIKNLRDAVETAEKAGRQDLVDHNRKQLAVLSPYIA